MNAQRAGRVLIASNRGPMSFSLAQDGTLSGRRGGGGVVSGLMSVAGRSEVLWVCAALSEADRAAAGAAPGGLLSLSPAGEEHASDPAGQPNSTVRMLDIPPRVFDQAYNGIANSVLWFVHHMLYDTPNQPRFDHEFRREWDSFRAYNAAFADALADGVAPGGGSGGGHATHAGGPPEVCAMVQDYHLSLVPRMLAQRRPGVPIAHFSHTPWAPPDYYMLLPGDVAAEVLDGMLGADHVGFHAQRWADAFLDCCRAVLGAEVSPADQAVRYQGHTTTVGVHPLGVDLAELRARSVESDVNAQVAALEAVAAGRRLIVRIDRTELSKNIVRGLAAYRELLTSQPEWRGRVIHAVFAYPSRHDLPEYREYTAGVQRLARQINDEFGADGWDPVLLEVNDNYPRSLAAYRLADVLLVNPIRDGMNLVAKEGPVLSDRGAVLILSREAGAAAELADGALLINPYDISGTAAALHEALTMPEAERLRRGALLTKACSAMPPAAWFGSQLDALAGIGHQG